MYDQIAEWAAALVQSNIAHVIFLTNDTSYSKSLSKSLPDRVFRQIALGDLSPDVAKNYVVSHFEGLDRADLASGAKRDPDSPDAEALTETQRRADLAELDDCIDTLGGRLADLEFLARRLKAGQSPKHAVAEIVEQSASEILKMFLLPNSNRGAPGDGSSSSSSSGGGGDRRWSSEQAWYLIRAIADSESLRYNEILLAGTFALSTNAAAADGEAALDALAALELITVRSLRGRPQSVRAGRPVYRAAFALLKSDAVLRAKMDLAVLTELAKIESRAIEKVEAELGLLGSLPRQPAQTAARANYLLAKLQASQAKITTYETEMVALKAVLSRDM